MRTTMTEALQNIFDHDTHLHLSFDLDCLDPDYWRRALGTGVRGGPTWREMQLCMEMIADTGRLGSLDAGRVTWRWTCAIAPPRSRSS